MGAFDFVGGHAVAAVACFDSADTVPRGPYLAVWRANVLTELAAGLVMKGVYLVGFRSAVQRGAASAAKPASGKAVKQYGARKGMARVVKGAYERFVHAGMGYRPHAGRWYRQGRASDVFPGAASQRISAPVGRIITSRSRIMKAFVKTILVGSTVFAVAFGAAVGAKYAYQAYQASAIGAVPAPQPPVGVLAEHALPGQLAQAQHAVYTAAPAVWGAEILMAGQRYAVQGDSIALPAQARFQLALKGLSPGHVGIYAVNPDGVLSAEPIFVGQVASDGTVQTNHLRLTGTKGLETLLVVHRDHMGRSQQQAVKLWHL